MAAARTLTPEGLQGVVEALTREGYTVLAPTLAEGAIDFRPVTSIAQLPAGCGDEQEPATYRVRRREDPALFAYACGTQSAKPVFFPADQILWRSRHGGSTPELDPGGEPAPRARYAVLGLKSCDLAAIGIHDRILTGRVASDVHYASRRTDAFLVAVTCTDPAGTCFCVSMGTGPVPQDGFDIALTGSYADGLHRFVAVAGSERGDALLAAVGAADAAPADIAAAAAAGRAAADRMGRRLDTEGLKNILYDNADSAVWDDVAERCLACTNCTLVCPTCFCTSVEDSGDLTGASGERHRVWDSCFSQDYSYIHGGPVRATTRARYRQWMTHKLAAWKDQFGTSGCVGCGRCVTWCPAGIDITAEAAELRRVAEHRQERKARHS